MAEKGGLCRTGLVLKRKKKCKGNLAASFAAGFIESRFALMAGGSSGQLCCWFHLVAVVDKTDLNNQRLLIFPELVLTNINRRSAATTASPAVFGEI